MYKGGDDIKPKNLKLHDFLIRKTGVKLMIDETIVDKVISHEKKGINQALKEKSEVEMSGFGKFYLSLPKLHKRIKRQGEIIDILMKRLEKDAGNQEFIRNLGIAEGELLYYKNRLKIYEDRHKGATSGNKELLFPSQGVEGTDRGNII